VEPTVRLLLVDVSIGSGTNLLREFEECLSVAVSFSFDDIVSVSIRSGLNFRRDFVEVSTGSMSNLRVIWDVSIGLGKSFLRVVFIVSIGSGLNFLGGVESVMVALVGSSNNGG
jgi:hypothetical protein